MSEVYREFQLTILWYILGFLIYVLYKSSHEMKLCKIELEESNPSEIDRSKSVVTQQPKFNEQRVVLYHKQHA